MTEIEPRQLADGRWRDVCQTCGTVMIGANVEDLEGQVCECWRSRTITYVVELTCLSCGRQVGTVTLDSPAAAVMMPRGLRCACGGRPIVDDMHRQTTYPAVARERERRGRPPRWWLEQQEIAS